MKESLNKQRLKHILQDAYQKGYQTNYVTIDEFIKEIRDQLLDISNKEQINSK